MELHTEDIFITPVTPDGWASFEAFFESIGRLRYCWCMAWRLTSGERKRGDSPAIRKSLMKDRVMAGMPMGLLACAGGDPVAWCSVGPRETFQNLSGDSSLNGVWSVTCFYITAPYRRMGLVSLLIDAAKDYARQNGASFLEAYPVLPDSPSYRHMGRVSTFERAGFRFVKMAGSRRHVMVFDL
jgi:hypothetical protein